MTRDRSSRTFLGVVHQWIARHPIAAFLSWSFTVGQMFAFAPLIARAVYGVTIPNGPFVLASTLVGLLVPTVVITRIVDGPDGVRSLWRRIRTVRVPLVWYAVALLGVPLTTMALTVALYGWPSQATAPAIASALGRGLLLQTVLVLVTNNLWEEVAWMGFVQARLQARHGALRAAVLTAPLFALQHVSLVAGNGLAAAVIVMVGISVLAVPFRALVGTAYNKTGSLFLVGVIHAIGNGMTGGSNFGGGGFLRLIYSADFELIGIMHQLGSAVIGIAFVVATRGRLGFRRSGCSAVPRLPAPTTVAAGPLVTAAGTPASPPATGSNRSQRPNANVSWSQRLQGLVRRHPLITFLVIFNIFGQALAFAPVIAGSVYGIELNREIILIVAAVLFLLLPALVITRISRGPEGLRALLHSMVQFRIRWWWYLLPLVILPVLTLVSTLAVPSGGLDARTLVMAYLTAYLPALLYQFITTNWWEETAWMGFVQAPLQGRYGPWRAVLITTPFFAFAHISALLDGTSIQIVVKFLLFTVVVIAIRALLAWVYNRTGSIAFVGLVHAASNASAFGLVPAVYHQTGDAAVPFLLLAIAAIAFSRGRLNAGNRQAALWQAQLGGLEEAA